MAKEACINPDCDSVTVDTTDSRDSDLGRKRRKFCRICHSAWTTYEVLACEAEALVAIRAALGAADRARNIRTGKPKAWVNQQRAAPRRDVPVI